MLCAAATALSLTGLSGAAGQSTGSDAVLVTTVDGPITPVIADHLDDAVERAERGLYAALIVQIDTPGGLDTSMRDIVQDLLDASVPVVVYVSPPGSRAASAGALITLSANVAAMAPGTAIGASTPVDLQGGEISDKVVNDAAAFAEAIAELRGRDEEVSIDMVREGLSLAADEALERGVIDLVSDTLPALLREIDGMTVTVGREARPVVLRTAGAVVDRYEMGFLRSIQQRLADPNLAFLFLSLGTLAIIYELATPGMGAGAIVGGTLILLALFSLSVLPINVVGLLFLALAGAFFVAELFAPGIGVGAAGGSVALVLSGLFLFEDTPGLEVSMAVIAPVAAVVGGAVVVAGRLVLRSRRAPSTTTGAGLLLGQVATVGRADPDRAQAFLAGAWWTVRSPGAELRPGDAVEIVDVDGLDLIVAVRTERDEHNVNDADDETPMEKGLEHHE